MKRTISFNYNSPVVLSFALISLAALIGNRMTGGALNYRLFSVYRSSLYDALTYPRFLLHVLGHSSYSHYIGNMMMILVIGPSLEERYGSRKLFWAIVMTALISGMIHWLFFRGALLGASGIVFMMIVMSSLSGMRNGTIPITFILVLILYLGGEIVDGIAIRDNVSQITHIIGGICGAAFGISLRR